MSLWIKPPAEWKRDGNGSEATSNANKARYVVYISVSMCMCQCMVQQHLPSGLTEVSVACYSHRERRVHIAEGKKQVHSDTVKGSGVAQS